MLAALRLGLPAFLASALLWQLFQPWSPVATVGPTGGVGRHAGPDQQAISGRASHEIEVGQISLLTSPRDIAGLERRATEAGLAPLAESGAIEPAAGARTAKPRPSVPATLAPPPPQPPPEPSRSALVSIWQGLMSIKGMRTGSSASDLAVARVAGRDAQPIPWPCEIVNYRSGDEQRVCSPAPRRGTVKQARIDRQSPHGGAPPTRRPEIEAVATAPVADFDLLAVSPAAGPTQTDLTPTAEPGPLFSFEMEVEEKLLLGVEGQLRRPVSIAIEPTPEALFLLRLRMFF